VAHVELSLSELSDSGARSIMERGIGFAGSLDLWSFAVASASEACVLLDVDGTVVALSPGSATLFAMDTRAAMGRPFVGGVLRLLDFNPISGELPGWEIDKIPPLLAMSSGGLARGLLRFTVGHGVADTVDAVSTPLRDGREIVGSLTFFAQVGGDL
jgi:hypothetical protein